MSTPEAITNTASGTGSNSTMFMVLALLIILAFGYIFYQQKQILERDTPLLIDGSGKDAKIQRTEPGSRISKSPIGVQFSYTFWIYVDDMNYNYGKAKHILHFGDSEGTKYCPGIWIYPETNNLYVRVNSYVDVNIPSTDFRSRIQDPCDVSDIPIQRWVCIGVVLNNRTLDVYVDGQLRRSCELDGVVKIPDGANLYINKNGGFSGKIANLRYYNRAISSTEVSSVNARGFQDWKFIETITSYTSPIRFNVDLN
jgi:hypothetical protein